MRAVGRKRWNDTELEKVIRSIAQDLGHFPTCSELGEIGRLDVANRIARSGGFRHWSAVTGIPRVMSDSDKGWAGEDAAAKRLEELGFAVTAQDGVKCPFDLLVDGILRVDVKAANYQEYGHSKGWFYRIGKQPQADMILLWQLDTKHFYSLPWYLCPFTNVTISTTGGKYVAYRNSVDVIKRMVSMRQQEREHMKPSALAAVNHAETSP